MSFMSQQHHSPVSLLSIILFHHHSASTRTTAARRQPHVLLLLLTTSVLLLCLPAPVASQSFINNGCLSLLGSTACRGFRDYYVGIPALARYGLSNNFSTIDQFDQAVNNYTISTRAYIADLGCYSAADLDDLNADPSKTFPYARYSKSRLCAALVQDSDSSLPCSNKQNVAPLPLCEATCEQWLSSVDSIITNHTDVCPNTGQPLVIANLRYLNSSCTDWSGFNGSAGYCVSGDSNEYNCGFSNSTSDACDYCSQHGTEACCQKVTSCSSGLSVGAIIGIVIAVIVVLVAIGLGLFFCFKRNKHIRKENSFSFKTYISPSTQHQQQHQQQQQLNAIGSDDGGGDHYSGNKILLQNDSNHYNPLSSTINTNMATQSSRQTGHRSQLSDPFGDHYEVVSLAPNNNNNHTTTTTTTTTPNSESILQDGGGGGGDTDGPAYEEEFYQVVHPYPPQVADELGLQVGDIVCLAMGFDDGWALGFNVTTGLKGVFPLVCVSLIPPAVLEQLLMSSDNQQQQNDMMDTLSTFSSKVLVEDDDSALDQPHQQRRLSRSSQLAISIRRIREDMRRSLSLSSSHRHPSPLSASNSISSRSMRPSSPSPSFLSHQNIPRRTASMVRQNNNNVNNYAECDSPTSPTHQTPLFNDTNHHLHQPSHNNDSFEMYHHPPSSNRISKQES